MEWARLASGTAPRATPGAPRSRSMCSTGYSTGPVSPPSWRNPSSRRSTTSHRRDGGAAPSVAFADFFGLLSCAGPVALVGSAAAPSCSGIAAGSPVSLSTVTCARWKRYGASALGSMEDAAPQGVPGVGAQYPFRERIEDRLAGVQPHARDIRFPLRPRPANALDLPLQLVDGDRDHRPEHRVLVVLVPLAGSIFEGVFIGAVDVEEVAPMGAIEPVLPAPQLRRVRVARAQIVDASFDLSDPPLEGAQQREGRACEPALEDAHREPHCRTVVERAAIGVEEVGGGGVVEGLLAVRAGGEVVAERVALAVRIERSAVESHHLFLGPADEVAFAGRPRESTERLPGREHLRVEQPPEEVVGRVPAHVRRRGEQEQVPHRPTETAVAPGRGGAAGKRFRKLVAPRLVDASALGGGAQLVRLVEDREIVGRHVRIAQRVEHPLAGQGVDRHDHEVACGSHQRIAHPHVRSGCPDSDARWRRPRRTNARTPTSSGPVRASGPAWSGIAAGRARGRGFRVPAGRARGTSARSFLPGKLCGNRRVFLVKRRGPRHSTPTELRRRTP